MVLLILLSGMSIVHYKNTPLQVTAYTNNNKSTDYSQNVLKVLKVKRSSGNFNYFIYTNLQSN